MKNNLLITIVLVVVVGAGAFLGGMQYEKTKALTANYQNSVANGGQGGRFGARFGNGANRPVVGKVVSSDANSITVQLSDGSSKIVNISTSTKITKTTTASLSDLTNGTQVAAFGATNADRSITAQSVQLNPMLGMFRVGVAPTAGQ